MAGLSNRCRRVHSCSQRLALSSSKRRCSAAATGAASYRNGLLLRRCGALCYCNYYRYHARYAHSTKTAANCHSARCVQCARQTLTASYFSTAVIIAVDRAEDAIVQEAAARLLYVSCRCEAVRAGLLAAGVVPVAPQALRRHGSHIDVSAACLLASGVYNYVQIFPVLCSN
jgi:hypothetical protein